MLDVGVAIVDIGCVMKLISAKKTLAGCVAVDSWSDWSCKKGDDEMEVAVAQSDCFTCPAMMARVFVGSQGAK